MGTGNDGNASFSSVRDAFVYLEAFANFEKKPMETSEYRLDRMAALLARMGNPQLACKSIHIAGSKGKGSTAAFCASILDQMGYKTALYMSPHITDYRERISLSSGFFSDKTYIQIINRIRDLVDEIDLDGNWQFSRPTTFELLTLAAYLIFRKENVEWMVIETGLGGRLDATNLMQPQACLITALELEHTDILGDTIEKIAFEKAGIFKPGAFLLSQNQVETAVGVLSRKAQEFSKSVIFPNKYFKADSGWNVELDLPNHGIRSSFFCKLGLAGEFQIMNAEIAIRAISLLWDAGLFPDHDTFESLSRALVAGLEKAHIRGRLELFTGTINSIEKLVTVDGAHTSRSAQLVAGDFLPTPNDILLFASVEGKNYREMAASLAPQFGKIVITTPGSFKKSDPPLVYSAFKKLNRNTVLEMHPDNALASVFSWLSDQPAGRALITGSFYLAGEIIPKLLLAGFKSTYED